MQGTRFTRRPRECGATIRLMSAGVEQKPGSAPRDLSMEEIEELRMISAFNAADLRHTLDGGYPGSWRRGENISLGNNRRPQRQPGRDA